VSSETLIDITKKKKKTLIDIQVDYLRVFEVVVIVYRKLEFTIFWEALESLLLV
jgi:hypothetical protein